LLNSYTRIRADKHRGNDTRSAVGAAKQRRFIEFALATPELHVAQDYRSRADLPDLIRHYQFGLQSWPFFIDTAYFQHVALYKAIRDGAFPPPVKVGERSSAWVKSEVLQWAQACVDASRPQNRPTPPYPGSSAKK
jgi:hypothetical protein